MTKTITATEHQSYADLLSSGKYQILSLDVFDTALLRGVLHPTEVFLTVGEQARDLLPGWTPRQFRRQRVRAERLARRRSPREDVPLDAIYAELAGLAGRTTAQMEAVKQLEIDAERRACVANPHILALYRQARAQGLAVVFVSDMYLPPAVIRDLLTRNGYESVEHVFVSSEAGVTKHGGRLFEVVKQALDLDAAAVLHIGDNYASDVEGARQAGIHAEHYAKCLELARKLRDPRFKRPRLHNQSPVESALTAVSLQVLYASRPTATTPQQDFWYHFGAAYVGPVFFGFMTWLLDRFATSDIQRVFFLSRDGYILQRMFELIETQQPLGLPFSYLYVSRRSLTFPSITTFDDETIRYLMEARSMLGGTTALTVADYLQRVGLDAMQFEDVLSQEGLTAQSVIINQADLKRLHRVFALLQEPILDQVRQERHLVQGYLEQEGFFAAQKVGIVDIGWNGTMQRALQRISQQTPDPPSITGFYFGTYPYAPNRDMAMHGYLVDRGRPVRHMNIVWETDGILELMFGAPHGSVTSYKRGASGVEPCLSDEPATGYRMDSIMRMHQGALDFVEAAVRQLGTDPLPIETVIHPLRQALFHPSRLEAETIGDIPHYETYGAHAVKVRYLAQPDTTISPLRAAQVFDDYQHAFWKLGYLRRSRANPLIRLGLAGARFSNRLLRSMRYRLLV